ncbi:MAG: hypothetical protein CVU57_02300 [Deltaproteobacteria bacterium HGW-Deltaproteobacteria-15]|jgi:hypothetical protein|nr:MAG: hypothetical protein CVU57_02300 [Deltaproteobacteria bacterium HGW-Deltaproteobacteria-15]
MEEHFYDVILLTLWGEGYFHLFKRALKSGAVAESVSSPGIGLPHLRLLRDGTHQGYRPFMFAGESILNREIYSRSG